MARRLKRRELRHDQFAETVVLVQHWVQDHAYLFAGALVVLLMAVLLTVGLVRRGQTRHREMGEVFARSAIDYARGNFQTAAVAFENFLARYPGSALAGEATLRAASSQLALGNTQDAQDLYQRYLSSYAGDPLLDRAARHGLAACYEAAGRFADAVPIYVELAQTAASKNEKTYHLQGAARCYEAQGNWPEAIRLLTELQQGAAGQPGDPATEARLAELLAKDHLATRREQPFSPRTTLPPVTPGS